MKKEVSIEDTAEGAARRIFAKHRAEDMHRHGGDKPGCLGIWLYGLLNLLERWGWYEYPISVPETSRWVMEPARTVELPVDIDNAEMKKMYFEPRFRRVETGIAVEVASDGQMRIAWQSMLVLGRWPDGELILSEVAIDAQARLEASFTQDRDLLLGLLAKGRMN